MNLSAIAKAILDLFEDSESDVYWLFSGFVKVWEAKLARINDMVTEHTVCNVVMATIQFPSRGTVL